MKSFRRREVLIRLFWRSEISSLENLSGAVEGGREFQGC